ncbi:AbrB/MazE/SpoVT family DNA-binding domain-containing protein [Bacillaceae bacterium Marseille-Q3522]|nr:AbrB/MazE/SpoVT family DNA-binding domain-containing protein [Bacillaceae bacterium Marseille-Q3522]
MKDVKFVNQMERKITKIGNSLGITLPLELLKQIGLAQGDNVQVQVIDGKIILRKKEQLHFPDGVDAEFMELLNDVIKEHDKAFKGLVDR